MFHLITILLDLFSTYSFSLSDEILNYISTRKVLRILHYFWCWLFRLFDWGCDCEFLLDSFSIFLDKGFDFSL